MATAIPNEIIQLALERFKVTAEAEFEGRKDAKDDMDFYVGNQWPDKVKADRQGDSRPCLTVNRLPQFVRQVTNDQRQNRPSIKVIPVEDSDEDVAQIYEGLVRHIQEASNADIAYDTACQTQVICGRGFFRIVTDYCDEDSFNQDILIKRIKNPLTVYVDPAAIEPDYCDAEFMFVVEDITHAEFKARFPGKAVVSSDDFMSEGDENSEWAKKETMRIAEYWSVEKEYGKLYQYADGTISDKKIEELGEPEKERDVVNKKIKWRLISAVEILDEKDWIGKYIPIIPVLGDDLDVDGKRYLKGMIRDAKDSQRMYNYWGSAETEAIALAPKAPFIMAEGQIEGYQKIWEQANVKNFAYLPYKPTSINGTQVPMPQRQTAEPPVQAMIHAMMQAGEDLKAITGIYDASLGARSNETSGKGIIARQKQGDIANYHFQDNLSRSIRHAGRILIDLIPKIYDAPRVVRILGENGEAQSIPVNQMMETNGVQKIYDVTTGKYDVVVETGPSYKTKRQEAAEAMTMILQANPELWAVAGDLFVKSLDWPNAAEVSERLKKMLPPELQDNNQQLPPQVKAQLEQAHQMIEQMTQQLNELKDKEDNKDKELESKENIAAMNNQTQLVIAEMNNNFGTFKEELAHLRAYFNREMQQEEAEEKLPVDNSESFDTMGGINTQ